MTLLAGWPSRNVTVYFHISIHKTSYTESTFISQEIRKQERIETIYQFLIKQLYWLCIRLSHINSLSFVLKTHKFLRFTWLWRQCQGGTVESVRAYVFVVCSKWDFELLLFVIQSAIISYEVVFSLTNRIILEIEIPSYCFGLKERRIEWTIPNSVCIHISISELTYFCKGDLPLARLK